MYFAPVPEQGLTKERVEAEKREYEREMRNKETQGTFLYFKFRSGNGNSYFCSNEK